MMNYRLEVKKLKDPLPSIEENIKNSFEYYLWGKILQREVDVKKN